jgi:hypothetical protein
VGQRSGIETTTNLKYGGSLINLIKQNIFFAFIIIQYHRLNAGHEINICLAIEKTLQHLNIRDVKWVSYYFDGILTTFTHQPCIFRNVTLNYQNDTVCVERF